MTSSRTSQATLLAAYTSPASRFANVTQGIILAEYRPPSAKFGDASQSAEFIAYAGDPGNVDAMVSQGAIFIAYREGIPGESRQAAWTFILDGHRFYVLPLGPEGDWAYDTTTQQWVQLQTQGFDGLNFTHGVMWDLRIMGGDQLYGTLYELDPNQELDEAWRPIDHIVTGGIASRSMNFTTVGNFRIAASVGDLQEDDAILNLRFSDDNGNTWSDYYPLTLTSGNFSQMLVWTSLGGFTLPGRVFEISDQAGLVSIYGADARLENHENDQLDEADQ